MCFVLCSLQRVDKLGDPILEEQYLTKNKDIKETIFR